MSVSSSFLFGLIGAAAALFGMLTFLLSFIMKLTRKWTLVEERLAELVRNKDETHAAMLAQMGEDRRASNERLTWLERNAWPTHSGKG